MEHTNDYIFEDCGRLGKGTEKDLKMVTFLKVCVAKSGKSDLRKNYIHYEVKTGAGELGNVNEKLVKGSSRVIYIPVVEEHLPVERQQGYVMDRELFLQILDECGLIRTKTSTAGFKKVTIQTFWNHSKNAPHGKKYFKLLEAFEGAEGVITLQEWLAQW